MDKQTINSFDSTTEGVYYAPTTKIIIISLHGHILGGSTEDPEDFDL